MAVIYRRFGLAIQRRSNKAGVIGHRPVSPALMSYILGIDNSRWRLRGYVVAPNGSRAGLWLTLLYAHTSVDTVPTGQWRRTADHVTSDSHKYLRYRVQTIVLFRLPHEAVYVQSCQTRH